MVATDRITPEAAQALIEAIKPLSGLGSNVFRDSAGYCCAIGALGVRDSNHRDPEDKGWLRANALGLAQWRSVVENREAWEITGACLAVTDVNDDGPVDETPAERKTRMLAWLRGIAEGGEG